MRSKVFLDSGIFIAFLNRKDRWHGAAVELFGSDPPARWTTSLLVVSETYSWFLHRMGEDAGRTFLDLLKSMEGLEVLEASIQHHVDVLRTLDHYRGVKLTYVDASSLTFLEERGIGQVWGTDRHLGLGGAEVQPGG